MCVFNKGFTIIEKILGSEPKDSFTIKSVKGTGVISLPKTVCLEGLSEIEGLVALSFKKRRVEIRYAA